MNLVGFKFQPGSTTRISADYLVPGHGEPDKAFIDRCEQNGFTAVDKRAVLDHYKFMRDEVIRGDLETRRHNYSIFCINLINDFNIATIIRNSNAFLARRVYLYGSRKYDRRGTVGAHNYEELQHVSCVEGIDEVFSKYDRVVGLELTPEAQPIHKYEWDPSINTLIVVGQESIGIPYDILDRCDDVVYIRQFGCVRSINVANAAAIAMSKYTESIP